MRIDETRTERKASAALIPHAPRFSFFRLPSFLSSSSSSSSTVLTTPDKLKPHVSAATVKQSIATTLANVFLPLPSPTPQAPIANKFRRRQSSASTESSLSDVDADVGSSSCIAAKPAVETAASAAPRKKCVRWKHAEVLHFRVGFNACAVPNSGGPPVGLIGAPIAIETHLILDADAEQLAEEDARPHLTANDCWLDPIERMEILQGENHLRAEDIAVMCELTRTIQESRRLSCLDFNVNLALDAEDTSRLKNLAQIRSCVVSRHPCHAREGVVLFDAST